MERLGYPYCQQILPISWGAVWSYLEFPKHLIVCGLYRPFVVDLGDGFLLLYKYQGGEIDDIVEGRLMDTSWMNSVASACCNHSRVFS